MKAQSISRYIRTLQRLHTHSTTATTSRANVRPRPTHVLLRPLTHRSEQLQQIEKPARNTVSKLMKKWSQLATIRARRRREKSPDRHYEEFQRTLQALQQRCRRNDSIRAYCWTIKYAKRELPHLTCIILMHRAATTVCTAAVATALERSFEDIAEITVVVTVSRKAFLRIAHRHVLP
jgi:hypothetical protein